MRGDSAEDSLPQLPESLTTQDSLSGQVAHEHDGNHSLVRRYTEDIDNQRIQLELKKAQKKYQKGRKLFETQNYFDCLMKLSKSLDSFDTIEPPSANLKKNLPKVYKTVKDCYLLSASCYIRMDQQKHAKNCLKLILKVEPSDP